MDYLVFRLYGPMASWGEIAVGESRHSARYPSKSAITGLLAAALGITREQDKEQANLVAAYTQAVKVLSGGHLLKDYHTAQAPDSTGKFIYRTRRDEIEIGMRDMKESKKSATVLSSREYRTDAHAVIAITASNDALYSLQVLLNALKKPKFHLYLGRKACALAAPLDPQLITADNYRQALDGYIVKPLLNASEHWQSDARWLPNDDMNHYYWEGAVDRFSNAPDFNPQQVQCLSRYDKPVSRTRWQFEPRAEYFWQCPTVTKEAS